MNEYEKNNRPNSCMKHLPTSCLCYYCRRFFSHEVIEEKRRSRSVVVVVVFLFFSGGDAMEYNKNNDDK